MSAGKSSEALPLAQGMVASLEKSDTGRELSAALNNLGVLEGYRGAAWLLRRQAVSVLPSVVSLKSLRAFARRDHGVKPMTGFGDPVFNPALEAPAERRAANGKVAARSIATIAYTDFWRGAGVDRARLAQALPQLPDTADELNAVARDVGAAEADIHLGRDASETTLKRAALAQYGIIYFATHGLVAGDIKGLGEPSLALSIPDQPTELDDGLLTASEVAQLKLNADWVVLSACNTIAGDKPGAEALSGLARSFFYAGARALLGLALGGGFGSCHPPDHDDFRVAQKRSKNRSCRSFAPRDVNLC
ncbi:CHAT domain-containing protein [Bradyrhizobium sp. LB13.1]